MFQRFTDKARRIVVLAQEEARELGHHDIGTDHLLLGLLRESTGVAAAALTSLGVSLADTRARVADSRAEAPPAASSTAAEAHIPFTPEAKRTLELALRESLHLGHDFIGTEHILLGLVREPDCRAAAILSELGADQAAITQRILELRPAGPQRPRSARTEPRFAEIRVKMDSVLSRLTAVERFTGLAPDLSDMDAELGRLRREKDEAIDAQDFRLAEALSDAETELIVDRNRRATDWLQRPSLAAEVAQLRVEVDRLRTILRTHGIDVDDIG